MHWFIAALQGGRDVQHSKLVHALLNGKQLLTSWVLGGFHLAGFEEEEEGLHWCVQAATPQRTPGIPESRI
jgi:hypothetical protein